MDTYDKRLALLRGNQDYRSMSSRRQYNEHLSLLIEELNKVESFATSENIVKDRVIKERMTNDFSPSFHNEHFKAQLDQMMAGYAAGDPQARTALVNYAKNTDFTQKLPVITEQVGRWAVTQRNADRLSGIPGAYANSIFTTQQIEGADDDKARESIYNLAKTLGDQEALDQLDGSYGQGTAIALNVLEEVTTALVGIAAGGLVKGATAAARTAKGLANTGRLGAWLAANSPGLLTEATVEGLRGAADWAHQGTAMGEENSTAGIIKAFGVHAGIDMLIGHTAEGLMGRIGAKGRALAEASEWAQRSPDGLKLAKGGSVGLPAAMDETTARHGAAYAMYKETAEILDARPKSTLTPLRQANYDGYEAGYRVTQMEDGNVMAQSSMHPSETKVFNNAYEAQEWIGAQQNKYLNDLLATDPEAAASYIARHPSSNYGKLREYSQNAWELPDAQKGYRQPMRRQHVNEFEYKEMGAREGSRPIRFEPVIDEDIAEEVASKGKNVWKMGDTIDAVPDPNGQAVINVTSVASPEDWAKANSVAQSILSKEGVGTLDEIARDQLIKWGYDAADMGNGKVRFLLADNAKLINESINPRTGKIGKTGFVFDAAGVGDEAAKAAKAADDAVEAAVDAPGTKVEKVQSAKAKTKKSVQDADKASRVRKGPAADPGFESEASRIVWMDYVARANPHVTGTIKYSDNAIRIVIDGTEETFDTLDDAMRRLISSDMTDFEVTQDLVQNGYSVTKNPKGTDGLVSYRIKDADGNLLGVQKEGTLNELYDDIEFEPSIPARYQPDVSIQNEIPDVNLIAGKEMAVAYPEQSAKFQGQFANPAQDAKAEVITKKKDGRTILRDAKGRFRAKVPELNHTEEFDSAKDAQQYINKTWKEDDGLKGAAQAKGLRFEYIDGKFNVFHKTETFVADTREAAIKELKRIKTPEVAKSMLPEDLLKEFDNLGIDVDLPPGFKKMTQRAADMLPQRDWSKAFVGGSNPTVWNKYGPRVMAIRRTLKEIDDAKGTNFSKMFERVHRATNFARSKTDADVKRLIEVFKPLGGYKQKRQGVYHVLEAWDDATAAAKVRKDYGLTDSDMSVARNLKAYYEDKAAELGIPFDRIISSYQPRVKKWLANRKPTEDGMLLTRELLEKNQDLRPLLDKRGFNFFAEFERTNDLSQVWQEVVALLVALRYTNAGNKKFYANDAWGDLFDAMKVNKGQVLDVDNGAALLLGSYKDSFAFPESAFHRSSVRRSMNKMMTKIGKDQKAAGEVADFLISLPYLSSMSFRPWLPLRNMFQVFTVGPLRTGSLTVQMRAATKAARNMGSTLEEMIGKGIIPKRGGMTAEYFQMLHEGGINVQSGVHGILKRGMGWYAKSDDFTRVTMYHASRDMFDKGMKKATLPNGSFDMDTFMRTSMADGLHPNQSAEVRRFMESGNTEGAFETLARYNIDATMFDYSAMNKPLGFASTFGHLFYQFGTYSFNYAQAVFTSLMHGSPGTKLKALTSMAAGMTAISLAAKEAGIDNSSFLGWNMATFNGGPWFGDMMDGLNALGRGPQAAMSRKELARRYIPVKITDEGVGLRYPTILPGAMQVKYGKRFLERVDDGDYWGAFLAATTTPEHKSRNE